MIRTLRRKFVLITMLLVSAVLLTVFIGIWLYNRNSIEQDGYIDLQMALDREDGPAGDHGNMFKVGGDVPSDFQRDPVFVISVSSDGTIKLLSADRVDVTTQELEEYAEQALAGDTDRGKLSQYDLRYLIKDKPGNTSIIAFAPLSFGRSMLRSVLLITGISIVVIFVMFLFASILLSRWALKPVEHSWEQQNRFVADASHELKTPLTVILANTGILKNDPVMASEQITWLDSTEKEARRMKDLVNDMLFLAKRDDGSRPAEKVSHTLSTIVETSALTFESLAFERGLSLEVEAEPDIRVSCDISQMRQLVGILVDNAVKYADKGSTIRVTLNQRQNHARLTVFNKGSVIPPEQLKQLFDRFYRTDTSRSTEGSGLGLSIARTIAEDHKGRIAVQSDENGILFTVELPME